MRISVDIKSIKDHDFRGNIYIKYQEIPELNIEKFQTNPPIEV